MSPDLFLKEVCSLLGLQWRAFQRRGVIRKVERRIGEIGLSHYEEYLSRVREDPQEQSLLLKILKVTISRFFRDREAFNCIEHSLLPELIAKGIERPLKIWSVGCASGEEPYSLCLLWKARFEKIYPERDLFVLATDVDDHMLERAKEGRYKKSSLQEVPEEILHRYFKIEGGFYVLNHEIRRTVQFRRHDIGQEEPFPGMNIVLCRNLAFTYFSKERQRDVLKKIAVSLEGKGYLVIGKDESLPLDYPTLFVPVFPAEKIYQKFNPDFNQ